MYFKKINCYFHRTSLFVEMALFSDTSVHQISIINITKLSQIRYVTLVINNHVSCITWQMDHSRENVCIWKCVFEKEKFVRKISKYFHFKRHPRCQTSYTSG